MTVSGGGASRVFQVDAGVTASISGLTITGGNASWQRRRPGQRRHDHADQLHRQRQLRSGDGGGLFNDGTAHADQLHRQRQLRHCTAENFSGSGVAACTTAARLTLTNCTVSGNSAMRYRRRRGQRDPLQPAATLTLTNCTVSGNIRRTAAA